MLEITEELLERMRNDSDYFDSSGNPITCCDFDADLLSLLKEYHRPDRVITSFEVARDLINLYLDRAIAVTLPDNVRYTELYFGGPLPTRLAVIPNSLCDREYFIMNSDSPDNPEMQVYRSNIGMY